MPATSFRFWFSENRGIVRQRRGPGLLWHPEVWRGQRWVTGSPYVMDAITGMGEDVWSCGESAVEWSPAQAERYAADHGIDLYSVADEPPCQVSGG
jgi:hypothetical protein